MINPLRALWDTTSLGPLSIWGRFALSVQCIDDSAALLDARTEDMARIIDGFWALGRVGDDVPAGLELLREAMPANAMALIDIGRGTINEAAAEILYAMMTEAREIIEGPFYSDSGANLSMWPTLRVLGNARRLGLKVTDAEIERFNTINHPTHIRRRETLNSGA